MLLQVHFEYKLYYFILGAGLSLPLHSFQFYSSSQFLKVVNPFIYLKQLPTGGNYPEEQLDTAYLPGPTNSPCMDCADMQHWPPLSYKASPWNLYLFVVNPPTRTLLKKPAWIMPWPQ